MKKIVWLTPNKMLFESEHKTFNKRCQVICTGNAITNTQRSGYIRPWSETKCFGAEFEPGHLRKFDMDGWPHMPSVVRSAVRCLTKVSKVILYEFYHHNDAYIRITHGWVITTPPPNPKVLFRQETGPTMKSISVIDEAIEYITGEPEEEDVGN